MFGLEGPHLIVTLAAGFGWLVNLALEVGLLVVAITVKKYRPDVWQWFLFAALGGLALALLSVVVSLGTNFLFSQVGVDAIIYTQAAQQVLGALLHGAVFVVLLVGIIKLARPEADAKVA